MNDSVSTIALDKGRKQCFINNITIKSSLKFIETRTRKAKSQRNKRRTGGASEETSADNEYTAPTPGLSKVLFTRGTTRDAARFIDTLNTLARHVGVQSWSQSTVTAKAMIKLVALPWTQPTKPVRMYYVTPTSAVPVTDPMTQTVRRFAAGTVTRNCAVDDDINWKMALSEWIVKEQKYQKDVEI